jgi:hypothetical protein
LYLQSKDIQQYLGVTRNSIQRLDIHNNLPPALIAVERFNPMLDFAATVAENCKYSGHW